MPRRFILVFLLLVLFAPYAFASQPLETETARLLPAGVAKLESTVEYQTSSEGSETSVPLVIEYGITNSLELLVEPVLYTSINPKHGPSANGVGDLEITLTYLVLNERSVLPAVAVAGEVKVPTAASVRIGTGEIDYTPFLIASKRFANWDTHVNLGYSILGDPPGIRLKNIFVYAVAAEYHLNDKVHLVGEVIGNTSSSPRVNTQTSGEAPDPGEAGTPSAENSLVPEATGGEVIGLLGARYFVQPDLFFFARRNVRQQPCCVVPSRGYVPVQRLLKRLERVCKSVGLFVSSERGSSLLRALCTDLGPTRIHAAARKCPCIRC